MTKAIRIHETGGAEVLKWEDVDVGEPGNGEVRVRHTAIGVNYIDIYHRTGLYPIPIPGGLGSEAAGVVEAVGPGVDNVQLGDRVAYAGGPAGSYSEARIMPAGPVLTLPESLADNEAAAILLKGMTVQFLIRRTYSVQDGETVLFHAAAGGVGLIACQWLKALGATVIGTVSSDEKAALAKANGCTHTINYKDENVVQRVKELTDGEGVPVVYDSVGKDTWDTSIDCLRRRGMMVSFGNTTGPVPPFSIAQLAAKGSLFVTRPVLGAYVADRSELEETAQDLFDAIESGKISATVQQSHPLANAAQAHRDLEDGKTKGSTILLP